MNYRALSIHSECHTHLGGNCDVSNDTLGRDGIRFVPGHLFRIPSFYNMGLTAWLVEHEIRYFLLEDDRQDSAFVLIPDDDQAMLFKLTFGGAA